MLIGFRIETGEAFEISCNDPGIRLDELAGLSA